MAVRQLAQSRVIEPIFCVRGDEGEAAEFVERVEAPTQSSADSIDGLLGNQANLAEPEMRLGVLGIFLNRRNIILMLMAIELILLAVNINLVAFSAFLGDLTGQVFAMFVLTVAAAEAAIGLAILVIFFRRRGSIAVDDADVMRG